MLSFYIDPCNLFKFTSLSKFLFMYKNMFLEPTHKKWKWLYTKQMTMNKNNDHYFWYADCVYAQVSYLW